MTNCALCPVPIHNSPGKTQTGESGRRKAATYTYYINKEKHRHTSIPRVGFESSVRDGEDFHASGRTATVIY